MSGSQQHGSLPDPVQRAIARAAADAAVAPERVRLQEYEHVDWPDTSLGVPLPGVLYAQVVTPGYRVRLSIDGRPAVYHTDLGERVVAAPAG